MLLVGFGPFHLERADGGGIRFLLCWQTNRAQREKKAPSPKAANVHELISHNRAAAASSLFDAIYPRYWIVLRALRWNVPLDLGRYMARRR